LGIVSSLITFAFDLLPQIRAAAVPKLLLGHLAQNRITLGASLHFSNLPNPPVSRQALLNYWQSLPDTNV
jgi:hypothetical protein